MKKRQFLISIIFFILVLPSISAQIINNLSITNTNPIEISMILENPAETIKDITISWNLTDSNNKILDLGSETFAVTNKPKNYAINILTDYSGEGKIKILAYYSQSENQLVSQSFNINPAELPTAKPSIKNNLLIYALIAITSLIIILIIIQILTYKKRASSFTINKIYK